MLSVEHVRARRDKDRLVLSRISERQRERVLEIAEWLLLETNARVGGTRDELDSALAQLQVGANERRLTEGLKKLVEDACEFQALPGVDPVALRRDLFLRAAERRRNASLESPFHRDSVLEESATTLGISASRLEEGLYADLRGAQRLLRGPGLAAGALLEAYEQGQVQAVLLRAVRVVARVRCESPDLYRTLFQKLKFRQLLYRLERLSGGEYRVTIDGPFSLFEGVTKYGLELALTLPALKACDVLDLTAEVLWGKTRTRLQFEYRHVSPSPAADSGPSLRDEVRELMQDFQRLEGAWRVQVAHEILELPGLGLCVPDLVFEHPKSSQPVYFELLGYWSRDAVFRRVELVEQGLSQRVVFGASSRLRVSEAVLDAEERAALYVYRGKPSARAVERKLQALLARHDSSPRLHPND